MTHRCTMSVLAGLVLLLPGVCLATDSFEPNDDPDQAHPIANGEEVESWISTPQDTDWYSFTMAEAGEVVIDLTSLPADFDLAAFVRDPDTDLLVHVGQSENPDTQDEHLSGTLAAGDYFLWIYGFDGAYDPDDSYLLRAVFQEGPVPVLETTWGAIKALFDE